MTGKPDTAGQAGAANDEASDFDRLHEVIELIRRHAATAADLRFGLAREAHKMTGLWPSEPNLIVIQRDGVAVEGTVVNTSGEALRIG